MPHVAMYHALKDFDVTLFQNPDDPPVAGFDFNPPDDIERAASGPNMPALQFSVFSPTALSNVELLVRFVVFHFNPNPGGQPHVVFTHNFEVFRRTFNGHVASTFTEFFPGNVIHTDEHHRFSFSLERGNTSLIISDVMVWFQRDI